MNDSGSNGKFAMFLLGSTAGAITALLLAPRSGKETRRRLRDALQQAGEKASELTSSLTESFGRDEQTLREGAVKSYDEAPHAAGGGQESARQGKGSVAKSDTTSQYNTSTPASSSSSARPSPSYRSDSPK